MAQQTENSAITPKRQPLPPWLRKRLVPARCFSSTAGILDSLQVATVCKEAKCPNLGECWNAGTATFMIMGCQCTRNCAFCAVDTNPHPAPLDASEPDRVGQAVYRLALRYAVVTSVTRDDLPDGGADHFSRTIQAIRTAAPACKVEVLTPDFAGSPDGVQLVCLAKPTVFNHNLETVERLSGRIRSGADYQRSLRVLAQAKKHLAQGYTKSGLMVGLGETDQEIHQALRDLRSVNCDILTIGQYLSPTANHMPVARYVEPDVFQEYAKTARSLGFLAVASGPFVRSSYQAEQLIESSA